MHYVRRGSGKPLLLVHGLGGSHHSWDTIVDALAMQRDLIIVDLPGFSITPPLPGEVSIATLSDAVTAFLAENGFTGIVDVFENEYGGFCTTFSRSTDRFDRDLLVKGLGTEFETLRIALKFYACVGSNHTTLDAIRTMQARHPFGSEDVARILVSGSRVTMDHVGWPYVPQGMTSAQLNLPYCVATLLLDGDVFVDQFTEAKLADPDRMRIAAKVAVAEDPAITARGSTYRHMVRVEVELLDGTRMEETVVAPRGSEHSFATAEDVIAKFSKLASRRIAPSRVERIVDQVMHAERMPSAAALVHSLASEA